MRDKIKLNSFAVELRRDWDLNPYSPIDLFSIKGLGFKPL